MQPFRTSEEELKPLIREAARIARILWERGWAERNAGNISVNLGRGCFLITVTGSRMRDLAEDPVPFLCKVETEKEGGARKVFALKQSVIVKPTSELDSHLAIHRMIEERGSAERAIIHAHPTELIALTLVREFQDEAALNRILPAMYAECAEFLTRGVGYLPYRISGNREIAEATLQKFKERDIVLWGKHGVMAAGKSLDDAFDRIDMLNKAAAIFLMLKQAGFEPDGLGEAEVKALRERARSLGL